jgi:hypothetical protein
LCACLLGITASSHQLTAPLKADDLCCGRNWESHRSRPCGSRMRIPCA